MCRRTSIGFDEKMKGDDYHDQIDVCFHLSGRLALGRAMYES